MHAQPAAALATPTRAGCPDALGPSSRRALTAGVLLIHGVAAWGLLQVEGVRDAVVQAAPVMVDWIAPVAPRPAPPPPPRAAPRPPTAKATVPTPVLAVPAAPTAAPFVAPGTLPEPPAPALTSELSTLPSPVATAAPTAPPAPPAAPTSLPSSAIHYLVPPAVVVPTASRRLNEQGTVWLRVVVDTQGMPQKVSVHQSSGFKRLDEQALQAMRAARFKPYIERGVALEWTAIAPLAYELE